MKSIATWLLSAALACCAHLAAAQELTPAQVAAAGAEVIKLVDESRFGELWDTASATLKKFSEKAQFNAALAKALQPLGAVVARNWVLVARRQLGADQGPAAGQYFSIEYETRFANDEARHELVSIRFDEDKVWRFSGYLLR